MEFEKAHEANDLDRMEKIQKVATKDLSLRGMGF